MAEKNYPVTVLKSENKQLPSTDDDKRKVDSITQGKIVEKSKLEKAAAMFFSEDIDLVKDSIVDEFIRPKFKTARNDAIRRVKEFIVNTITGVAQIIFFGKSSVKGGSSSTGLYNGERVNYVNYYTDDPSGSTYYYRAGDADRALAGGLKRVKIDNYLTAEKVLRCLLQEIKDHKVAKVGYYYQLVGLKTDRTDFGYGWFDLDQVDILPLDGGGYILGLPKPVSIP